jgi:hypothetical protein
MNITQITVSYGETQSLPEYSNVKPAITLTATIDEDESPDNAEAVLWERAKESVHNQVDLALEANDKPAKYSQEPRYQVMATYTNNSYDRGRPKLPNLIVLLPDAFDHRERYDKVLVHAIYPEGRNMRYEHALRVAFKAARERDAELIDCADGDTAQLDTALAVMESNPEVAPTDEKRLYEERLSARYGGRTKITLV